jgi:hypothetical protein
VLSDEAQVFAARLHFGCFGLELVTGQVEVELLAAELESVTFIAAGNISDYSTHDYTINL